MINKKVFEELPITESLILFLIVWVSAGIIIWALEWNFWITAPMLYLLILGWLVHKKNL